jgi:hypothetical protein
MTTVQEPPDVPKWVDALETGYQTLTTSVMRANHEFYYTNKLVRSLHVHSIEGAFSEDVLHKNAHQFAAAVFKNLGDELAHKGVPVEIPGNDLPETILPMNLKDFKDPLSFSPIKLYQYLFEKYAGKNSQALVLGRVARGFTRAFGHNAWEFAYDGNSGDPRDLERKRLPKLDTFFEKSFEQKGGFYNGYITATQGDTFGRIASMIDWKYDSRGEIRQNIENLADLLVLTDSGKPFVNNIRLLAKLIGEKTSGKDIAYGWRSIHGESLLFTFRKEKLEVKFSTAFMDDIRTFLLNHHPDFKR